jgi:4a-hydroxytetrahydrobiopterin dehydratase
MTVALLSRGDLEQAIADDLPTWGIRDDAITRDVHAASFMDGVALVQRVAEAAEARDHHPDIDIRWTTVTFTLSTHSEGGITAKDLDLAAEIDRLAAGSLPSSSVAPTGQRYIPPLRPGSSGG